MPPACDWAAIIATTVCKLFGGLNAGNLNEPRASQGFYDLAERASLRRYSGHLANSLDERVFPVETINRLMESPEWRELAIIIAYDDSDGGAGRHLRGPLRLCSPSTAHRDFTVGAPELRGPYSDRPVVHSAIRRRQLSACLGRAQDSYRVAS
jgi:hypothetical protein